MITELFLRLSYRNPVNKPAPDSALLKLKKHCQKLPRQQNQAHYLHQLDKLLLRYLFQPDAVSTSNTAHDDAMTALHSPAYRQYLLQQLPLKLHKLRTACRNQKLPQVSRQFQQQAIMLANQPPFAGQHTVIQSIHQLQQALPAEQCQMVLYAAQLQQHCLGNACDDNEQRLWQQGLLQAFICSKLATPPHLQPSDAFLCAMVHYLSLLFIYRQLPEHYSTGTESRILALLPRLDYWLAKDLGLPDYLLNILRSRFLEPEHPHRFNETLQQGKHAALAFLLYQQQSFSRNQLQQFLHAMQLDHLQLPEQLLNTTH